MTEDDDDQTPASETAAYGIAALSLLEALILVLKERELITDAAMDEAFDAAIEAHRSANGVHSPRENARAARILHRLRVEGNSVRLEL